MENEDKKEAGILEKREKKLIDWFKDKYNLSLFLVIVFAVVIRIYYFIMAQNQPLWWDEAEYMVIAQGWASGADVALDPVRQVLFPFIIFVYPTGARHGRIPVWHLLRNPRFTFTPRLSFSSFAWEHKIIRRNFSFGLLLNDWEKVRIVMSFP